MLRMAPSTSPLYVCCLSLLAHAPPFAAEILLAARQGDVAKVQQFLQCACDTCRKLPPGGLTCGNGWTALLVAAKHGRTAVVESLLAAKADVEATVTTTASTALIQAAAYFHPDVVRLLLNAGAKVYRADNQGEGAGLRGRLLTVSSSFLAGWRHIIVRVLAWSRSYGWHWAIHTQLLVLPLVCVCWWCLLLFQ
jgi:hypothetical protein